MKTVLANGVPKSGTNVLIKLGELMGFKTGNCTRENKPTVPGGFNHGHVSSLYRDVVQDNFDVHIQIIRDPRNVLLSWCRHRERDWSEESLLWGIENYHEGVSMAQYYSLFVPWIAEHDVVFVRFETMFTSPLEIMNVCKAVGVPYDRSFIENLEGGTRTYYADHSDWPKHWTPKVDRKWHEYNMPFFERWLGYDWEGPYVKH